VSAQNADLDAYVARQAATVGRAAAGEVKGAPPASPIGRFKGASGACLGIFDDYARSYGSAGAGAVAFAADGRSVFYARDDGVLNRWALPSGARLWSTQPKEGGHDGYFSIAVSLDGKYAVTAQKNRELRRYEIETGNLMWRNDAPPHATPWTLAFSPDGKEFVSGGTGDVHIHETRSGLTRMRLESSGPNFGVAWSPTGKHIAAGNAFGSVRIWDAKTGALLVVEKLHKRDINGITWSPDGTRIATASEDCTIGIWSPFTKEPARYIEGHASFLWCVAWSPEGLRIATGANDRTLRIWDAARGTELGRYEFLEDFAFRIAWSPDGNLLASSHPCTARLWDVRETLRAVAAAPRLLTSGPLPADLAALPGALVALLRIRRVAPISLLRDLLALTGGRVPSPEAQPLASHPGLAALASLRWPTEARVALVLLLLRDFEDLSFSPPEGITIADLRWRLLDALAGAVQDHVAPPLPVAFLQRALDFIDERVLTLLGSLGPDACADDPALPLSLLARLSELAPRIAVDRRLLALRVPTTSLGAAEAKGPWLEPSGFSSSGSVLHLAPSQWTLPDDVFQYRAVSGGLLYRARFGREPPRLRPLVLVLDVSPASFGPVEVMLRSAAHALAASLLDAGIPAFFVAAGGDDTSRPLTRRADLFEILTARSRAPISTAKTMALAAELCAALPSNGPFSPAIVLLSHPSFGAEDTDVALPPRLAGLFVHYPGHPAEPACKRHLTRAICIGPSDAGRLPEALGQVLA
jgi:WD40 repeat protein